MRERSFGQEERPTIVDRFGVWLSASAIRRWVPRFDGLRIGDFGCGYDAPFVRSVLNDVKAAVVIDVALAPDLKSNSKVAALEGDLLEQLPSIGSETLDVVLAISVLEHLWEPLPVLREFRRILAPGGTCLINVPSWRGKKFLELSAFRLGLSPAAEMNDHKAYYDVKDLWPLLVRAGFIPRNIRCYPHKFGLNTFAVCRA